MGIYYKKADAEVNQVIKQMMKKYHGHLLTDAIGIDVTVDALFAYSDKGPAVMLHGRECYAKVRIVNLRDRVKGMSDSEIIIDAEKWQDMKEEVRNALIDHELEHLELSLKKGAISFDEIGRPKLKIKHHDIDVGWFKCIAERHGQASIEVTQAHEIYAENEQLLFNFDRPKSSLVIPNASKEKLEFAIHATSKMLEIRDRFKTMNGDQYQHNLKMMINFVRSEIKKSSSGESEISVITRLAKKALEEDGQMMRHDGIIAAYVEMHETVAA